MANSKVKKTGTGAFAKGGSGHMFGKMQAGKQVGNNTATGGRTGGGKFAEGGSGHMSGKNTAKPRTPSKTGQ